MRRGPSTSVGGPAHTADDAQRSRDTDRFTGHLNRVLGQPGATGVGDRSRQLRRRRVRPSRRGNRRKRRPAEACRATLRGRSRRVGEAIGLSGDASRLGATEQWYGAAGSGATPTGLGEDGSDWHQDRWHGQPGQRESVTTGSVAGNRYRNRKAASPAAPQGETGDVLIELKANARRSTSGGSVRLRCPGGALRKRQHRRGSLLFHLGNVVCHGATPPPPGGLFPPETTALHRGSTFCSPVVQLRSRRASDGTTRTEGS